VTDASDEAPGDGATGAQNAANDATPAGDADPAAVREFHRQFATGVTVVTAMDGERPRGLAVNAFASVSLEPPVIMVCVARQSETAPALHESAHLAVNMLAADQVAIARRFAISGGDKFAELEWRPGTNSAPILAGAAGHLEGRIERRVPAYTHTIFIVRVEAAETHPRSPMVYVRGEFHDAATLATPGGGGAR